MRSSRATAILAAVALLSAAPAAAQGGSDLTPPPCIDPATAVDLEGEIISYSAGPGQGPPTLVVDDAARSETPVRLGPYWYLTEEGFEVAAGERVRIRAYSCGAPGAPDDAPYVAGRVENLTRGSELTLRNAEGVPRWLDRPGRGGRGGRSDGWGRGRGAGWGTSKGVGPRAGRGYGIGRGLGPCGIGAGPRLRLGPHWRQGYGPGLRPGCRCNRG